MSEDITKVKTTLKVVRWYNIRDDAGGGWIYEHHNTEKLAKEVADLYKDTRKYITIALKLSGLCEVEVEEWQLKWIENKNKLAEE